MTALLANNGAPDPSTPGHVPEVRTSYSSATEDVNGCREFGIRACFLDGAVMGNHLPALKMVNTHKGAKGLEEES